MIMKFGDWQKYADRLHKGATKSASALDKAVKKQAVILSTDIKKNIQSSGSYAGAPFAPLKPSTIARKGSSKPLIDTGDMMRSVQAKKIEDFTYLVGIPGNMTGGKTKQTIAMYAKMHENGGITANGQLVIARPWLRPTVEKFGEERKKAVEEEMKQLLGI